MYWSFDFLKRGTPQNLVLAPGASIQINTINLKAGSTYIIVYRKGDMVKDPMKPVSYVPETIPGCGASRSPLNRLSGDWHNWKRCIFIQVIVGHPTCNA